MSYITPADETTTGYNGWANYETWNVALWIGNDEGLYDMARRLRHGLHPYGDFNDMMLELGSKETPDGVAWDDDSLDMDELNEMMAEL